VKKISPHQKGLVRRFLREYVRPYLGLQVEIGFCLLVSVFLNLIDPIILRAIIDRALGDGDSNLLLILILILAGVLVFRVGFRLITVWLYSYSGLRILFDFRQKVFEHVERLSPYFFRGEQLGDILARLTSDIDELQQAAAHTIVNAVQDILTILGIMVLLFWLDVKLTLALVLVYPLLIGILARINNRLRDEGLRAREAMAGLFSFLEERIANIRLVQEFTREKAEAGRHVRVSRPWIGSNLSLSVIGAGQISLADMMSTGAFILVFLLGGMRVLDGTLSLGSLVAFYTLASRLYRPISGLIDINIDLQVARASLLRVYELLDMEPDIKDHPQAATPPKISGAVELREVGLTWPDGTRALNDITMTVDAGQVVALVGPSGSGKSTLAALAARYLDPQEGTISIDGLDLRRWKLKDLHHAVGVVPQETQLFHDTIAANLRLARRNASESDLYSALETAGLADFVSNLPKGLMTLVGEQGLRLSGGERQRLALARSLLKAPFVHILDEATSALDPRTERQVLERYFTAVRGRTVILIAHRLTSVTNVDLIFVLNEGSLVESGSHNQLYQAGGLYRSLFDEQSRERAM
jgi:ABC-type multidrug transport system fused ATPase/permease subunit